MNRQTHLRLTPLVSEQLLHLLCNLFCVCIHRRRYLNITKLHKTLQLQERFIWLIYCVPLYRMKSSLFQRRSSWSWRIWWNGRLPIGRVGRRVCGPCPWNPPSWKSWGRTVREKRFTNTESPPSTAASTSRTSWKRKLNSVYSMISYSSRLSVSNNTASITTQSSEPLSMCGSALAQLRLKNRVPATVKVMFHCWSDSVVPHSWCCMTVLAVSEETFRKESVCSVCKAGKSHTSSFIYAFTLLTVFLIVLDLGGLW